MGDAAAIGGLGREGLVDMDRVEVWLKKFTAEAETGDVHKLTYHVISQSGQEIAVKANFSMVDNPLYGKLVYQTMTMA